MKKWLSLTLAALMALAALPAFAEADALHWLNSSVLGYVTADTQVSPRDDFHLAVNKEWLVNAEIPKGKSKYSVFTEHEKVVREQILSLVTGEALPSHEGQLVQELYRSYTDMDERNERGMQPIMSSIELIKSIRTIDELTAFMQREDQYVNCIMSTSVSADYENSSIHSVFIAPRSFTLGDADEYKQITPVGERAKDAYFPMIEKLLVRIGYAPDEAAAIIDDMHELETELGKASFGLSVERLTEYRAMKYNPVSADELSQLSPVFPIMEILKPYTDLGVSRFILTEKDWLARLNELYTPENLDKFKAWLLCRALRLTAPYLDQECIDICDEAQSIISGITIQSDIENDAFDTCSSELPMAIGRMYVDSFVAPGTKQDVEGIIKDVVAVYKKRLENTTWLGEQTRAMAIEKLDNLKAFVAYPDDWSIYDVSDIVFTDDMSLLDELIAIDAHDRREKYKRSIEPVDPHRWSSSSPPQTVNAFYRPTANSITIPAGILGNVFYNANASIEENLGGIGMVISHEITHGFDSVGSQYDQYGNMKSWWTDEDHEEFERRTAKVDEYFSAIEMLPGEYVDGLLTIGESVADMGAMSCMLEIAQDIEGFDYAKLFTTFARIWPRIMPVEEMQKTLRDPHPPANLRTNVTVQQFDEFYQAFGVEPGDGMYLAPERRLAVW